MSPNRLVIGIDCSTTACKAIAWDETGRAVAEGRATYPLLQPAPGWYEQDAEQWWNGVCAALKELLGRVDVARVDALCITHQRESFVPVDSQGQPIRHAMLWLDERSRAQVTFLEQAIGRERLHRLTGQFRTSLACADPMGLVDMQAHAWAADLIGELGLRVEKFSDLLAPGDVIGHVSAAAAAVTGLPAGLAIIAGAGDGQCAGLGANATGGGRVALNMGTAVVGGTFNAEYLTELAFRTLYAPVSGYYYLESVIQGGVVTVAWFVDKFAGHLRGTASPLSPEEMLEAEAAKVPPGSLGLMLVPYWSNAMTPYWDTAATGITVGWTGAHGREHFYRAILEGIAFEQRLIGDAMTVAIGHPLGEYVVMGGGSRSRLWCQIVADVTGVPVVRSTTSEATCLGAGILAAAAAGWYPDAISAANAMTGTAERFTPDPATQAAYDRLYREVYQPLFPTLQPLLHRLAALRS